MIKLSSKPEPLFAEINITPFTDVLLVLLIVFMILAALVVPPGFQRSFPNRCCDGRIRPVVASLQVVIRADGTTFVNSKKTSAAAIYRDLATALARGRYRGIELAADSKAPYQSVIRVFDAAKFDNAPDVTLVTE
ncbi:MAG: biopolymer transporter ExbD [Candidatus Eremiobacteraeota bacterium]|nr:biopolymer transporter ExbD [Candidatus Eremiobacteraeota bacterium]